MRVLWLMAAAAFADVPAEDRWLGNANLVAGVNADGSFGNDALDLGFLWDPDGPAGPMPTTGDLMWVGYRWDVWGWDWRTDGGDEGEQSHAAPHIDNDHAIDWTRRVDNDAVAALLGSMTTDAAAVDVRIVMLKRADVILHDLHYTPTEDWSRLRVGRTVDPDQDYWLLETYATTNTLGADWVSAESALDERAVALAGRTADGSMATPGLCSWCDTPAAMADGAGEPGSGDVHPNVLLSHAAIAAGETAEVRFAYAFAVGGEAAGLMAVDALAIDDLDDDGVGPDEGDCDDLDPTTHPGATERFDGIDNDCDGAVDEDTLEGDDDGDGFSEAEGDCDDTDPSVFPGADGVDGVTNADCDGIADDDTAMPGDTGEASDTGGTDGPTDTGVNADPSDDDAPSETNDLDADGPIVIGKQPSGCTCSSSGSAPAWGWLVLAGLLHRRKRAS